MIAKEDILELLRSTESYLVERTVSTGNMDKFCEAICAFANDMPAPARTAIRLYQFDNYIEVMNAGGLYSEAHPENFPWVNDYRNPLIAEAMRVMKYVNKFNRDVTRVQEMLKDNGNPPAEFDVNTITTFRVNVHATNEADLSKGISQPPSQSIEEKIVEFCKEPRSGAEIAVYCGFKDVKNFRERYLTPLLGTRIQMTIPDKPTSRFQKYIIISF